MLVSIGIAAKYLGVRPETLRKWEVKGYLQVYRTPGNQRRYDTNDLETLKANNKRIERRG